MPQTRRDAPEPSSFLPLTPVVFEILLSLADEDRHGYAIIQEVTARTKGDVRIGAGTLYRSLQRMVDQGYVSELTMRERPAASQDDARRRYYRLTPFGRAVAEAETRRLGELVRLARASGFTPRKA